MSDTLDILRQIALQVRNASAPAENTAERVGRVLVGILENLSQTDIEDLKAIFLRKDQPDKASEIIDFLKGLTINGGKASIDKDGIATVQELIALVKAQLAALEVVGTAKAKDVEVSNQVTTLDLVVQALAKTYNLTVDNTADIMHGIIREYLTSESFVSGFLGSGFKIWKDANGDWNGEFDKLTVRKIFTIFELVVQKVVHQGGMVIRSAAGGKLVKVTDGGTYWKCEHDSTDDFLLDDQVLCQTFTGVTVKRYWRKVTSAGAGYFNLSKTDCEAGSASPEDGDDVAVLGNRTNTDRQSAQIDCAVGVNAPYRDDYAGINSYSLEGKLINRTGNLSGITDPDFGVLSGSGLIGMNAYLKGVFRLKSSGKLVEDAISDAQSESNAYTDGKITTVETNFEIREGQISSKVTQATTAATQASGYATSAQGSASTANTKASEAAGSASTATTKATAASNSANAAAGSATTAGQKAADAADSATAAQDAADDAATILSQVTTKESSINQTASNITLQVSEVTTKVTTATNAANTATTKAGEASTSATNAANSANQASNILTTVTSKETSINQTAQAIELKAVRAESAAGRAESAEASINLKADGIVLQASSQAAQQAVNGVQIGGRNLLSNSFVAGANTTVIQDGVSIIAGANSDTFFFLKPASDLTSYRGRQLTLSFWVSGLTSTISFAWDNRNELEFTLELKNGLNTLTFVDNNLGVGNILFDDKVRTPQDTPIFLTQFKLELGNKATAWTPAPEDVEADAQTKANTAESNAKSYANSTFTTKTEFSSQLSVLNNSISAKVSQTDFNSLNTRVTSAEQKITSDAIISTVSSTITTAKNEAINAAAADATTKANAAKSSAVSTAATDATTKANAAESNAKTYSNNTFTPLTTYNTKIAQLESSISLKADSTTVSGINTRLSSAEAKITPDAINLTVRSQITTAVDAVQVGGRNLALSSGSYINNSEYCIRNYNLSQDLVAGEIYTATIWGSLYSTKSHFGAWMGGGYTFVGAFSKLKEGLYRVTFTAPSAIGGNGLRNVVNIYTVPSNVVGASTITAFKIEQGNKATDWTPAPEDVDASIALRPTTEEIKSQFTMDSSGISMMGKKIALTGLITFSSLASDAQTKITSAQSTANQALGSISNLSADIGAMAYYDNVSLAKLDSTIVEGGYIKTSLIDANTIITGSLLANKIATTDITTTRLTVSEGCTVGGFAIGNGRIGSIASATGSGGELAIYSNFFRIGGSSGYAMLGDNVIPATAGGAFNATGRIVNQTVNQGAYWGYDACNTGLYISVSGGTKNFGIDSNAALKAPAFINTRVKYLVFGTTYSIDLSQYSIFMCYAASAKSVTMPDEASIAKQFSLSSLPSDFGCVFTFTVIGGSSNITLNNVIDWNMSSINLILAQGDAVQLLVTKFPNFHYKIINHTN